MIDLARFGDRPAIEAADGRVTTYAELDGLARRHATSSLAELPAERTVDFVARCLGALLGGGAFRPIDPCDPRPRPPIAMVDGLAYVIATSGSTGAPKHVMVSRRGLPALWQTQVDAFALGPGARSLWLHAPMFDASISDWGTALAAGATLVLPTSNAVTRLSDELADRAITHVDLPPSLLARLDPPPRLRVVVLGGEACDVDRVRALARRVRVVVVYGPTEATVCSSLVVVDPARWTRPLIGHPLPGITYRVIDGELHIAGDDALALGYANDPAETTRRFVIVDGARMYRTGDRVEQLPDGLAFAGRIDRQVKLRGRRVELDEIEAVLRRFVDDAAVILHAQRVVAFVTAPVERSSLREVLPGWMVPSRVIVGELPRTATGKIDRAALEQRALPAPRLDVDMPPHGDLDGEVQLLAIAWCNALGVDTVRLDDRFSEVGGDSLARLMLKVALDARTAVRNTGHADETRARLADFDIDDLLDGDPTFAEVVARLRSGQGARHDVTVGECEARARAIFDARLTVDAAARPSIKRASGDLLITGANGFLGRALVRAWRHREPSRRIIGLVRDVSAVGVDLGVDELVRGDVRDDAWHGALRSRVSAVVHCAATIQLGGGWDAHVETNVHGTAQIARFVGDDIAWHHISTLSVFVNTDRARGRHLATDNPAVDAIAYGGYAQTKIAAEAIARACGASIYRLGLLVGSDDDQRAMTLRALAKLGAAPAGFRDASYDETPVAYAADAIAAEIIGATCHRPDTGATCRRPDTGATCHRPDTGRTMFHIAAGSTRFGDVIDRMKLVELPHAVWLERARASIHDPDIAMAIGAFSRRPELSLFLATDAEFR
ncbi:MAG: AMP-binding protein [Myxococcota bacterium]|nr:AMP-binding protein [Myxococcota bacterium]